MEITPIEDVNSIPWHRRLMSKNLPIYDALRGLEINHALRMKFDEPKDLSTIIHQNFRKQRGNGTFTCRRIKQDKTEWAVLRIK